VRPRGTDLHYEVELALIIGKRARDLDANDEEAALDCIGSKCMHHNFQPAQGMLMMKAMF
jgi:2-keto-4-pentenoate hydratase/2-oxohepta-3-ene-1,7-dioic acid hydratase in catechol pathway